MVYRKYVFLLYGFVSVCLFYVAKDDCMLLVMEFVANGCLRDFLKRPENSQLSAIERLRFGRETLEVNLFRVRFFFHLSCRSLYDMRLSLFSYSSAVITIFLSSVELS